MDQIIIHVDMDAFFAAVEIQDNPALKGKPLIIGALPTERGVVATCSYEARKYGIHSAMNIKEAYRLCPNGIYMHPNIEKYRAVSERLHRIWAPYASAAETVALDEAYLDVTEKAVTWEGAREIARTIKQRTRDELELTCSVGVAYSKTAAKTASEEKKPDGYFEIQTPQDYVNLIIDRNVGVLYSVGAKTAEKLAVIGIRTVRDIQERQNEVVRLLGKQGRWIVEQAFGQDSQKVTTWRPEDAKSVSRELTFQADVTDHDYLKDVLLLLALNVERRLSSVGLYGSGVTLKITYADMKSITRSKPVHPARSAAVLYREACALLDQIPRGAVRLIGAGYHSLSGEAGRQLRFEDILPEMAIGGAELISSELARMEECYGLDFAGNLDRIFQGETLYRTVEYMRRHKE